jgi:hypothetical protein
MWNDHRLDCATESDFVTGHDFSRAVNAPITTRALAPEGILVLANDLRTETESPATAQLYIELWVSLASLLRSYTAAHGLNGNKQATVELGEEKIVVRHADDWLELNRNGAEITWTREDGTTGTLSFTQHGRLRGETDEEEMDMAAERWARELML